MSDPGDPHHNPRDNPYRPPGGWAGRLAFSFLIVAAVLAYLAAGAAGAARVGYALGAAACFALGLYGVARRHRG